MRRFQFRLRGLIVIVFIFAVLLKGVTCLYQTHENAVRSVEDSYAISQVADMLIYHIRTQKGTPPGSWQDLENAYQWVNSGYGMFSLEELRARVRIDFVGLTVAVTAFRQNRHYQDGIGIVSLKGIGHSEGAEVEANDRLLSQIRFIGREGDSMPQ